MLIEGELKRPQLQDEGGGDMVFKFQANERWNEKTGKLEVGFLVGDEHTEFLLNYGLNYHPDSMAELIKSGYGQNEANKFFTQMHNESRNRLIAFQQRILNGGDALSEVHAAFLNNPMDYEGQDPKGLRQDLLKYVKEHSLRDNPPDEKMLTSGYDAIAALYTLHTAQPEYQGDPVAAHTAVTQAVGRSLLSYDGVRGEYTLLTEQVEAARKKVGWNPQQLTKRTDQWLRDLIKMRTQEQKKTKEITEKRLLEAYRSRGG